MRPHSTWLFAPLTFGVLMLTAGCGDDAATPFSGTGGGATTTTSVGTGGDGTGGTGQASSSSGLGGINQTGSGGSGGEQGCLSTEAAAKTLELDIIVVLDRSASMTGALWDGSVTALTQFFSAPGGSGINTGLNYFPPPGNVSECNPSSYNPLQVPIVSLDTDAAKLVNDMMAKSPNGNFTPTHGALYGSLQYANTYQDNNPDHVVIVVFASDGDPTSCNTSVQDIAAIADTAYAYNGVRTFVIAIKGATLANLNQIAKAGGTNQAFDVTKDVTLFKQKMDEIRKSVLACEFLIPKPQMGQEFDAKKVNIKYTPGDNTPASNIPQAANAADCGGNPGWYYDNPVAPTKITFCPATCAAIQKDGGAKVNFVFGCATILN